MIAFLREMLFPEPVSAEGLARRSIHRPAPPMPECKPPMPEHQVLKVKVGDTVVITADRVLSVEQRTFMAQAVKGQFPEGVKVMILDGGMKIAVVSPQTGPSHPTHSHAITRTMNIQPALTQIAEDKRALESRIRDLIGAEVAAFTKDTGVAVTSVDINFVSCLLDMRPHYLLGAVTVTLDLL